MSLTPLAIATKDNATGQLNAGISASATSIPLQSGQGASFPQPYNGAATSGGTAATLNCTGISATIGGSAAVGKFIQNFTDGSSAAILTVSTNSVTTTALLGGTDNTWENADAWRIDPFVLTIEHHDAAVSYNVTAREEVLVYGRSTDTLLVASASERGYNGTTAQTWLTSDYVYLHVTSPIVERLKDLVSVLAQQLDTDTTNITNITNGSTFYIASTGSSNAYAATYSPAPAALVAGLRLTFKANFTNSGSATFNPNSLGAGTIKKVDGATNLASGDIQNGQIVTLEYDGTNWQMGTLLGNPPPTVTNYLKSVYLGYSDVTLSNPTSTTYLGTHVYTIPANDLVSGVVYECLWSGSCVRAAGNMSFNIAFGTTSLTNGDYSFGTMAGNGEWFVKGRIWGTTTAGASVAVRCQFEAGATNASVFVADYQATTGIATNGTLLLNLGVKFSSSNASNSITAGVCRIDKESTSAFI